MNSNALPPKRRAAEGKLCSILPPGAKSAVCPDKAAFSLVELLALIVIVGILTALLGPAFSAATEEAKQAQCRDNIRAQLTAMHLFAEDHFDQPPGPDAPLDSYPSYWYITNGSADDAPGHLYPDYVDDVTPFLCPSTQNVIRPHVADRHGRLVDLAANAINRDDDRGGHSYEYFGLYGTREMAGIVKTPETTTGLEAVTYLVSDGDDSGFQNCPDPTNNHWEAGANFGFVSGHVEWMSHSDVNRVHSDSFHSESCPDLAVWIEGTGQATVRIVEGGEPNETEVTANQGFSLASAQQVEIEIEPDAETVFTGWSGSFSGSDSPLSILDWTDPLIAVARFQAVNEPGAALRISHIDQAGGIITLIIENPSGAPFQVQRKVGSLAGDWETVAVDQTEEAWTGPLPPDADRGFWRVTQ